MQWLFPAIIATLASSLIFTLAFLYLYKYEKESSFGILTLSWFLYSLRYVCALLLVNNSSSSLLLILNQLFPLAGAFLLFWGISAWLGKPFPSFVLVISILMSGWIITGVSLQISFKLLTLPSFVFMGFIYIRTGVIFIRKFPEKAIGKYITGWAFILWGLHKMNFPFLRPLEWFAPWGYLMASVFTLIAAIGLILVYFEEARHELVKSRENFRNIINHSPMPTVITDERQTPVMVNETFTRQFGYTLDDIKNPEDWWRKAYPDPEDRTRSRDIWKNLIRDAFKNRSAVNYLEGELTAKDGRKRFCEFRMVPLDSSSLTIINDITERKEVEAGINASIKEKETLLQEIHHRVKNNMQVISSMLSLQSYSLEEPRIKEALMESQNRIQVMSSIHETLYRSDNMSEIHIYDFVKTLSNNLVQAFRVDTGRISLELNIDEFSLTIGQASPFGLVLNELISNALKHGFPDGKSGRIQVEVRLDRDEQVRVMVKDNGRGIPDGFDWRNTGSLGLKLVTALVENQLEGSITLENNSGTTILFDFSLRS